MAQLYTIKCPKCGCVFGIGKGVLMSWDFSKPIPEDLRDEMPFNCPDCKHRMCVKDEHFLNCVVTVVDAD